MIFAILSAYATGPVPCETKTEREDTSCWLDDWKKEGRATLNLGIRKGKKTVEILLDDEVVSSGELEGARLHRRAALDGCGADFHILEDGRLKLKLDGPECPIEAVGIYERVKPRPKHGPTHCKWGTQFTCTTSTKKVLSVCDGMEGLSYVYGPLGAPELRLTGGKTINEDLPNRDEYRWSFASGKISYQVIETVSPTLISARVEVIDSGKQIANIICEGEWYRAK